MALKLMVQASAPIPLDVKLEVSAGQLLALVGPSGSGKTTLLRTIAGLWCPSLARVEVGGEVWLDTENGVNLAPFRRHVGMVFQNYALFPHMTAARNVMAAMASGEPDPLAEAHKLLDLVNLAGLADRKPMQLSGGQQQRVAVARALARRPQVLLLDEPFAAVDMATREILQQEILSLRGVLRMPIVLVTHDLNEAQRLADRLAILDRGRLISHGATADVMTDPEALRVLNIRDIGAMLRAEVEEHTEDGLTRLSTAGGMIYLPTISAAPGTQVRVRVMAHDVIVACDEPRGLSAQNILHGSIAEMTTGSGPGVMVHIRIGQDTVLARITRRAANQLQLSRGGRVYAVLKSMSVARDQITPERTEIPPR